MRDADTAFAHGAHLAAVLTCVASIETYLRSEYGIKPKQSLYDLINSSPLHEELKDQLHSQRRYRNEWVHVRNPWDDEELQTHPQVIDQELEIKHLRQSEPYV